MSCKFRNNYKIWRRIMQKYLKCSDKEAKLVYRKIFYGGSGGAGDLPFLKNLREEVPRAAAHNLQLPRFAFFGTHSGNRRNPVFSRLAAALNFAEHEALEKCAKDLTAKPLCLIHDGALVTCTAAAERNAVMIERQAAQSYHGFDVWVKNWPLDLLSAPEEKSRRESFVDVGTATKGRELEKRSGDFACLYDAVAALFPASEYSYPASHGPFAVAGYADWVANKSGEMFTDEKRQR